MEAVCQHLEAVKDGKINQLIINIPPRTGKTTLISILFPAWYWIHHPNDHILTGSFSTEATHTPAYTGRLVVDSHLYGQVSKGIKIAADQNQKTMYRTNRGGTRVARSTGAGVTGLTANLLILDDPMSSVQAASDTERSKIITNFYSGFLTRRTPPGQAPVIIVSQRLSEDDLVGTLLPNEDWERLILPLEFDGRHRSKTSLGWKDPRSPGDIMHPHIFTKDVVADLKDQGSYFYSSQYQQDPTAEDGNMFRPETFGRFINPPKMKRRVLVADTAFKTGTRNDYSILMELGQTEEGDVYVLDVMRGKWEFNQLQQEMVKFANERQGYQAFIVEDKASGQSLIQELRRHTAIPIKPVVPGRDAPASKIERATLVTPWSDNGKLHIPYGKLSEYPWVGDFVNELKSFPHGRHDDQVDALSYGVLWLAKNKGSARVRVL